MGFLDEEPRLAPLDTLSRNERRMRVNGLSACTTLDAAFELSKTLVLGNAYHVKRGIYLLDQSAKDVLAHLREEVDELDAEPDDILEMADILALCANYSARKGWTPAMLSDAMEHKMRLRLTLKEKIV
jgi:hypothetical protein